MRFSMLYSREQILSFKSCLVFYAGDSLKLHQVVSKAMLCFLENIWLRCGVCVSKMTSKSSNLENCNITDEVFNLKLAP